MLRQQRHGPSVLLVWWLIVNFPLFLDPMSGWRMNTIKQVHNLDKGALLFPTRDQVTHNTPVVRKVVSLVMSLSMMCLPRGTP